MSNLFEESGAEFSPCRKYRYALWRIWNSSKPYVAFIGLNPSTAAESVDDPTIRRVKRFAQDWGYGGVIMLNLFPYVTAYPEELKDRLIGMDEENKKWLLDMTRRCDGVVFAWGSFKQAQEKSAEVMEMFPNAWCLGRSKGGQPKHPLYIKADTKPIRYVPF